MENSNKIILDLCGGTGAWSKPYKDAGYDVRVITLPEHDVRTYKPPENVYGVLAAPPCTMFSLARTRGKTPRNFKEGMECIKACLNIIWESRMQTVYRKEGGLKFWALENPMGFLRQFLGLPALTFDPYDYGDPYTKKTDLWGYFNKPRTCSVDFNKIEKGYIHTISPTGKPMKKFDTLLNEEINFRKETKHLSRSARRAITPPGFAKAFFEANR
jgi:site-specific DNA-cytosine methylase